MSCVIYWWIVALPTMKIPATDFISNLNSVSYFQLLQINSKYSEELAAESLEWIKEITSEPINTSGDPDNFFEVLKDGVLLCKLINCIKPGSIKKVNESKMAFKCMENITGNIFCLQSKKFLASQKNWNFFFFDSAFLDHAKQLGVPPQETFQSVDLWERQNLNSVVICLQSLGRKVRFLFDSSIPLRNETLFFLWIETKNL